jgi:2-iminobutanoate/2-iminopropanoate deaminase
MRLDACGHAPLAPFYLEGPSMDPIFHIISDGPKPVAPYSHVVEVGEWLFVTGQLATGRDPSEPLPQGIEAQTRKVMENLRVVLAHVGAGFEHVVQARVFLTDFPRDYARMNEIYLEYFDLKRLPARTTVGVTHLALGGIIEIDLICRRVPA